MEADFTQYYNTNLYDLYDPESKVDTRWVVVHATQLPEYSRTMIAERHGRLTQDQHIALDTNDLLNTLVYVSSIAASAALAKGEFKKAMKNAPKPIDRGEEELKKKEKPRFLTARELMGQIGNMKPKVIEHTESCKNSRIYAETGDCHCPVIERG